MDGVLQDLKYAVRSLTRSAATTIVIVATLALAMGTSAVMFTVAESVLQSVPARDRDRVVSIAATDPQHGRPRLEVSVPEFVDWQARSRSFDAIGAITFSTVNLTNVPAPMRLRAIRASADFFAALGVRAQSGRLFTVADDRAGNECVALLTDQFWRRQFAADPAAVGRPLTLDGKTCTVVGVLPASIDIGALRRQDVWIPLSADAARATRDQRVLYVLGRLKPGVTRPQSAAEMSGIARQLEQEYPTTNAGIGIAVDPAIEAFGGRGNIRFVIGLLLLLAALIVWIACANVANVVLSRAMGRRRELAIRSAIGASRIRLVRQQLVEDVVLSVLGGAAGLLLCAWEVDAVKAVAGRDMVIFSDMAVDGRVVLFALGVCLVAPVVFGLWPAVRAAALSGPDLRDGLKDGSRTATAGLRGGRTRGVLVACQVALAIALLVEVGSIARAARAFATIDKGINTHDLLTLRIDLPASAYSASRRVREFYETLTSRVADMPGVRAVAAIDWLPIVNRERPVRFVIDGVAAPRAGDEPWAGLASVTPGYRRAMEIPLVGGRDFSSDDSGDAPPVVIVSRFAAQRYWPSSNPIGQHIQLVQTDGPEPRRVEVIGVVGDVWTGNREAGVIPQLYVPQAQWPQRTMALVVRAPGDGVAIADTIRRLVLEIDKDQPIYDIKTMERHLYEDLADTYILLGMLIALAAIALGLAAAGIYGVISCAVTQRTHEIGVRMALGAGSGSVRRLIVAQGLVPVGIGAIVGLAIGFGLVQTTAAAMREMHPRDPLTYGAVIVLVGTVALAASYLPARRATKIDPIAALRAD